METTKEVTTSLSTFESLMFTDVSVNVDSIRVPQDDWRATISVLNKVRHKLCFQLVLSINKQPTQNQKTIIKHLLPILIIPSSMVFYLKKTLVSKLQTSYDAD